MNDTELYALLKAEKTPAELEQLMRKAAVARLSDLLHTLLCPLSHDKDCDYYIEEETTGQSTSKMEWVWRTTRVLEKAKISQEELGLLITRIPGIVSIIKEPAILRFLNQLMPTLLTMATVSPTVLPGETSSSLCDPLDSDESPEEL